MLEMPEPWDTCQGEMLTGSGNSPRERSMLVHKDERNWISALTSDMEMQSLEFAQLVFDRVFVQYFLTMFPSLGFGMIMYILCH